MVSHTLRLFRSCVSSVTVFSLEPHRCIICGWSLQKRRKVKAKLFKCSQDHQSLWFTLAGFDLFHLFCVIYLTGYSIEGLSLHVARIKKRRNIFALQTTAHYSNSSSFFGISEWTRNRNLRLHLLSNQFTSASESLFGSV